MGKILNSNNPKFWKQNIVKILNCENVIFWKRKNIYYKIANIISLLIIQTLFFFFNYSIFFIWIYQFMRIKNSEEKNIIVKTQHSTTWQVSLKAALWNLAIFLPQLLCISLVYLGPCAHVALILGNKVTLLWNDPGHLFNDTSLPPHSKNHLEIKEQYTHMR